MGIIIAWLMWVVEGSAMRAELHPHVLNDSQNHEAGYTE